MENPITINIDLDNVLGDFTGSMKRVSESALNRELPDSNTWDIHLDWDIPLGLWKRMFRDGVRDGQIWGMDEIIPGALEGMWELSDSGYYLRILTHRLAHTNDYDFAVQLTANWLKINHFPYRSLAVIGAEPKSNYLAEALIDDGGHNIKDWVEAGRPNAIVFDQPWNQDVKGAGIYRAMNWKEVVALVKGRVII